MPMGRAASFSRKETAAIPSRIAERTTMTWKGVAHRNPDDAAGRKIESGQPARHVVDNDSQAGDMR